MQFFLFCNTGSAMDGASSVSKGTGQFSFGKLMGKNCMEAFFPAFRGSGIRLHCFATRFAGPYNRA
ncbi:MAG TPA: hypothetical protein DCP61_00335 [Treponema sp.]|nr:hypothetical protein [Treponema sp.]